MAESQNKSDQNQTEQNVDLDQQDMCCIEASVVTGFEECARGEAKEKFGTAVQAARGKIVWQVPISRVREVVKMGSIDNCRVVLKSVPHFKFTNDQNDSLARLQQMVLDMDWEKGLRVWRCFFDFPHPIAPRPDVVPAPEDLVDVVIIERKHHKDPNAKRHNKKGGRGKKKDRKKDKRADDAGKGDADTKIGNADGVKDDNQNAATEERDLESQTCINAPDLGTGSCDVEKVTTESESQVVKEENQCSNGSLEKPRESEKCLEAKEKIEKMRQGKIGKPIEVDGRTHVILKRPDPNRPEPKIEVKVLIPVPNESVFPTQVNDNDQRNEEPMDVDLSVSVGKPAEENSREKGKAVVLNDKNHPADEDNELSEEKFYDAVENSAQCSLGEDEGKPSEQTVSATTDFASNLIERLKSSSPSPTPPVEVLSSSPHICTTPPSTPVILASNSTLNPLAAPWQSQSLSTEAKKKVNGSSNEDLVSDGSSVDPPTASSPPCKSLSNSTPVTNSAVAPSKDIPLEETDSPLSPLTESCTRGTDDDLDGEAKVQQQATAIVSTTEVVSGADGDSPAKKTPQVKRERDPTKPTFRVTCNRVGEGHAFDSSSAAASLGSSIIRYFNWGVDLKNFDIEVLLNIDNEEVTVGIGLTKSSLHNRNLVAFGPTTLRATICYNMLRLCRIRTGDIICDPMCGTSALPVEGAMNWVNSFHFGGDYHELAMERSMKNINALRVKQQLEKRGTMKIGLVQWNLNHFPLRDRCIDVFISDLPFGHRMGSRTTNRTLYPTLLSEMARTARNGARACLLTEDKTSLIKAIQTFGRFWQRRLILSINMGGLSGYVFLLTRTTTAYSPPDDAVCGAKDQTKASENSDASEPQASNVQEGETSTTSTSETSTVAEGEKSMTSTNETSTVAEGEKSTTSNSDTLKATEGETSQSTTSTNEPSRGAEGETQESTVGALSSNMDAVSVGSEKTTAEMPVSVGEANGADCSIDANIVSSNGDSVQNGEKDDVENGPAKDEIVSGE